MILGRTQHTTDTQLAGRLVRRTLKNWSNYRTPAGLWMPTDHAVENVQSVPDDWEGPDFNFTRHVCRGPMQLYFGNTADPDNTTMIGARLSNVLGKWFQVQAQDVTLGVPMQVVAEEKQVRWVNLWPQSSLVYQAMPGGFRKYLHLREGHPDSFRFAVRIPAGGSIVPVGGGAEILDGQGNVHVRIPSPWGMDSSGGDPLNGMGQPVRVTMEWGASFTEPSGNHVQVLRFVPNPDDLDAAVYPVLLDPTATIPYGDLSDASMLGYSPQTVNNWGGHTTLWCGRGGSAGIIVRGLVSYLTGSIPSGTITAHRFISTRFSNANSAVGGTVYAHPVVKEWGEGDNVGTAADPGECSATAARAVAENWATLNCGNGTTDYRSAEGSLGDAYVAFTSGGDVPFTINLPTDWATNWRDSIWSNYGFRIIGNEGNNLTFLFLRSTENGSNEPYVEIDHTPAVGGVAQRFFFMGSN